MAKKTIPAISVIIPMYNTEKYIGECLDSILAQTFDDYEVIVVDDCSTDNSTKIVESYIPKFNGKLQLVRSENNSGGCPGIPRNTGMRLSRGEYIMFIDSDDAITKTALEELYSTAKNFDADALHCGRWYQYQAEDITTNKNLLSETSWEREKFEKSVLVSDNFEERIRDFSQDKFWSGSVSNVVSREMLMQHNIMFPACSASEDFIFKFQIICHAKKLVRSASIFYVWRQRKNSTCHAELPIKERFLRWGFPTFHQIGFLDDLMKEFIFFQQHPEYKYEIFNLLLNKNIPSPHQILPIYTQIPAYQLDGLIRQELEQIKDKTALTAFLFNRMNILSLTVRNLQIQNQKMQMQLQQVADIILKNNKK